MCARAMLPVLSTVSAEACRTATSGGERPTRLARTDHTDRPHANVGEPAEEAAAGQPYDLIFSNAALQWLPDHASLLGRLTAALTPNGQLAFQVPANEDHPS